MSATTQSATPYATAYERRLALAASTRCRPTVFLEGHRWRNDDDELCIGEPEATDIERGSAAEALLFRVSREGAPRGVMHFRTPMEYAQWWEATHGEPARGLPWAAVEHWAAKTGDDPTLRAWWESLTGA